MADISLRSLIAPSFYGLHDAIRRRKYTHHWLKGGRGSTKSSFVALEMVLGVMSAPDTNGVAMRRYGNTLQESVYAQLLWAIDILGVTKLWRASLSPLRLTYRPTGQMIIFRGADDPIKIKSIKFRHGYARYIWYEELNEFDGMEAIRSLNQSLMRGGPRFDVFYTYNPPASINNWVNKEVLIPRDDRIVHHSTYESVPPAWLGEQFIREAEHLRDTQPERYQHEYGGEVTGTGGEIFRNVRVEAITDEQAASFDNIRQGIDWGFADDPFVFEKMHYDGKRRRLYIFGEVYACGMKNNAAADSVKKIYHDRTLTICDSAEPKSIREFADYDIRVMGAKKGPDSVEYGIKWLQDLEEIIIDPVRCPHAAEEFCGYELLPDKNGGFIHRYPDKDNHTIDAVRYACELDIRASKRKSKPDAAPKEYAFESLKPPKDPYGRGTAIQPF